MGLGGVKSDTMVRKYKKKIGIQFMNYTEENVEKALSDIRTKQKSLLQAAEYYGIPKSTLHDKVKGKSTQKQGGQIAIPIQEEKMLADGIAICRMGLSFDKVQCALFSERLFGQKRGYHQGIQEQSSRNRMVLQFYEEEQMFDGTFCSKHQKIQSKCYQGDCQRIFFKFG